MGAPDGGERAQQAVEFLSNKVPRHAERRGLERADAAELRRQEWDARFADFLLEMEATDN